MNDRILGYLLISLILAFLSVPTSLIIWKTAHPLPTRTIEFEPVKSVNFLNIQDPVMVHGREIGQVRSIENKNRKLFLKIETRNDLIIFRNYKIAILSKGVMGDRYLDINPGDSTAARINQQEILRGEFILGAPEALTYIGKLNNAIRALIILTDALKNGTLEKASFVTSFNSAINDFDAILLNINTATLQLNDGFNSAIDTITSVLRQTTILTQTISTSVPDILNNLEKLITKADSLFGQIDTFLDKTVSFKNKLDNPDLIIWKDDLLEAKNELDSLRIFINMLKDDGLKLKLNIKGFKKKEKRVSKKQPL